MQENEQTTDPLILTQDLIRCPSVTPEEGGALTYLQNVLEKAGFECTRLPFSEDGTPDVDNLYARIGTKAPHLCFAGHTDVVPTGSPQSWTHPPFDAVIDNGWLFGRGAVDMKGGVACFLAATLEILKNQNIAEIGSLSFLITGDEEGPAINGTPKMLKWLQAEGQTIDHCLVGEPTNPDKVGDAIKIGRRGTMNGTLIVKGKQGHVAYPASAENPIPGLIDILQNFLAEPLDAGTEYFSPSNLEITNIDVGNTATNVIPERASASFNIRFNHIHTADTLREHLRSLASQALKNKKLVHEFRFPPSGSCFLTEPGQLSNCLLDSIKKVTGLEAELSTGGGTSDARYIKDYCPVIEFGLVNQTIHQIDERVEVKDLYTLTDIYKNFINSYFNTFT